MQQPQTSQDDPSVVLVLDVMALRRAKMVSFLREWAVENQVLIMVATPAEMPAPVVAGARFGMAVLSLGAASLAVPPQNQWLKGLRDALTETAVVVVSDREDPDEVVTAARAGARGYLPTSTEPEIALRILSFVLKGGSFFPPSALLDEVAPRRSLRIHVKRKSDGREARSLPNLTLRQMAVLNHLQAGMSNKLIGILLGVSESTVKDHIRHIMRRLGAVNRTQAALAAGAGVPRDLSGAQDETGRDHCDVVPGQT